MGKAYTKVPNDKRKELIRLIYEDNLSIIRAAERLDIYYPTAKAINKVYKREKRIQKRSFRYRVKNDDEELGVIRKVIPIEKIATEPIDLEKTKRLTCGVRLRLKGENMECLKWENEKLSAVNNNASTREEDESAGSEVTTE